MTELNDTPLQNGSLEEAATPEGECLRGAHPRSSPGDPLTPPSIIAVESQHEDWAEVYQMAPTPLLTLSASGTVITANRCACELLTQPETSLRGRPFLHFICSQDRANVQERIWISGLAIERYETRLALPDGGVVPVQVGLRRSRGASGAHLLITLLELRDSKRRIPAERSARAASDARDQFMAMLSHELRTPLTPVLAAAARLRRNPALGAAARELLDMIQRNVAAEARMIDNLLDTTGILRGQLHVFKQPVELNGLLADCVEAQQEKAARKGVSISYAPAFGEYFAEGDASRLRQVFSNLLDNAVKFTSEGGKVEVQSLGSDGRLTIELSDSGVGFEASEGSKLFSAFGQLHRGATAIGGLGLGLSISKGIIELHGGTIAATSRGPGLGSRFVIELPTWDAPDSATLASKPECREVTEIITVVHKQILLVEDHADTAEIMTMLFEEQGFSVLAFDSVEAALSVDLKGIDVLVSDIGLPDGTGMDLVQRIRHVRDIPAIALSGYGMESDVENALRAGFDLHFTKPVDFERLLTAIHALLESRALPRAAQAVQ